MEILVSKERVTISGNIKTVSDYQAIKSAIDKIADKESDIHIEILDSISITSSIIGYFNKLILKDKKHLTMEIGSEQLMELIDELNLKALFNATKI
jgi:hypothetical protein